LMGAVVADERRDGPNDLLRGESYQSRARRHACRRASRQRAAPDGFPRADFDWRAWPSWPRRSCVGPPVLAPRARAFGAGWRK
jgi:hypothetical protein